MPGSNVFQDLSTRMFSLGPQRSERSAEGRKSPEVLETPLIRFLNINCHGPEARLTTSNGYVMKTDGILKPSL